MFNLTNYLIGMFYNDPIMLIVQLIIIPGFVMAGLVVLHDWYNKRKNKNRIPRNDYKIVRHNNHNCTGEHS